jgi:hypothetical protein
MRLVDEHYYLGGQPDSYRALVDAVRRDLEAARTTQITGCSRTVKRHTGYLQAALEEATVS